MTTPAAASPRAARALLVCALLVACSDTAGTPAADTTRDTRPSSPRDTVATQTQDSVSPADTRDLDTRPPIVDSRVEDTVADTRVTVDTAADAVSDTVGPVDAMDIADSAAADTADTTPADTTPPWRAAPCEAGTCCTDGLTLPPGTRCKPFANGTEAGPLDVEFRCATDPDGLERRIAYPGCDGTVGYCRYEFSDMVWGEWERTADCECITSEASGRLPPSWGLVTTFDGPRCADHWRLWSEAQGHACLVRMDFDGGGYSLRAAGESCSLNTQSKLNTRRCVDGGGTNAYEQRNPEIGAVCSGAPEGGCVTGAPRESWRSWFQRSCEPGEVCQETDDGAACVHSDRDCTGDGDDPCCDGETSLRAVQGSFGECARVEGRCIDQLAQRRPVFNECDGASTACTSVAEPGAWEDIETCELPYVCEEGYCKVQPGGCFNDGPCCDPVTKTSRPYGTQCSPTRVVPANQSGEETWGGCLDSLTTGYVELAQYDICKNGGVLCRWEPSFAPSSTRLTYTCPEGTTCYAGSERGLRGQCVGDEFTCEANTTCCSSVGFPLAAGTTCGDPLETVASCDLDEDRPVKQTSYGTCTGDGAVCSTAPANIRWRDTAGSYAPCTGDDRACAVIDGEPRCIAAGAKPCASGPCCDDGFTRQAGYACSAGTVASERRCIDEASVEGRTAKHACDGVNGACPSDSGHYAWTPWAKVATCSTGNSCRLDASGEAACLIIPEPCDEGSCCDLTTNSVKPQGASCGERWRIEETCAGDEVRARNIDYACDGQFADCRRLTSLVVVGSWRVAFSCPGCHRDSGGEYQCGDPGTPTGGACGAPCSTDATCTNGNCEGGQCAPAQCSGCWAQGKSCRHSASCGFLECVTSTPGAGTCYRNDEVMARTGMSVASTALSLVEVKARVINFIGEPVRRIDYRYEATSVGSTLPASAKVWVAVRGDAGETWYLNHSINVPPDRTWTTNISGSPPGGWGGLLCGGPGAPTQCLGASATKALFDAGLCYTGFIVTAS